MSIPYYALDISDPIIDRLEGNPAPHERMALATGSLCSSDQERLGLCVLLASDEDKFVAKTAKRTISSWDIRRLSDAIHRQTHAKVLEYVLEFLEYNESLDQLIFSCVQLNERSALLIAERASIHTCEEIAKNRQQLLLTPSILTVLQKNENCPEEVLSRVESFLKMQHALPKEGEEISVRKESSGPAADLDIDIEKEVEALLKGERSPFLMLALSSSLDMFQLDDQGEGSDFSFDFSDTDGFDFDVEVFFLYEFFSIERLKSRILSRASEALEMSSRRKMSFFLYKEWMISFIIRSVWAPKELVSAFWLRAFLGQGLFGPGAFWAFAKTPGLPDV